MIYLPRSASRFVDLTAGRSARYALSAIRVRQTPDGWRIEATDGSVLGVLRGPSLPSKADLRAAEGLPRPEALALEALLPASGFQRAFRNLPKDDHRGTRHVGVLL